MPDFGSDQLSAEGALQGAFPPSKVGRVRHEPRLAITYFRYSSVGVPSGLKGYKKLELHTLSIARSTESSLPCYRGIKTNKHSTRKVFLDNGESLVYCVILFFIEFISRLQCVGLL